MYFRKIESDAKAMREHNDNQRAAAAHRLKHIAELKRKAKATK